MENLLKQRGIVECRLEVREDNHPAIKLYHKLGYQTLGKLAAILWQETRSAFKKSL